MLLQLPITMTSVLYHVNKTFGVSGNKTSQLLFCVKLYLQSTVQLTFEMSRFPLRDIPRNGSVSGNTKGRCFKIF